MRYSTNELGDVISVVEDDGIERPVDPSSWGWLRRRGVNDPGEHRRSIASLAWLPGFTLGPPEDVDAFVPGPKARGAWRAWRAGAAPPAAVESSGGTRAFFDRVSEAAGAVAGWLPVRDLVDGTTAMTIWDFVVGRAHMVSYAPPGDQPPGSARVYVLDDGVAVKVGVTWGAVATRVRALQTGNPRPIVVMAEIAGADESVEMAIHDALRSANVSGEWFDRRTVIEQVTAAGGVRPWLRCFPAVGDLPVHVHPPYR